MSLEDIDCIRKHKKRMITLANIPIGLPLLNKQCMTEEEAYASLKGMSLLVQTNIIE
ncbi:MAG: hypothetical protein J6A75_01100 [Lachnospiraceae bacterium]|nr:hypothetical protein [Lachnospiraceae bacterium]